MLSLQLSFKYLCTPFLESSKASLIGAGALVIVVNDPVTLCEGLFLANFL